MVHLIIALLARLSEKLLTGVSTVGDSRTHTDMLRETGTTIKELINVKRVAFITSAKGSKNNFKMF